MGSEGALSCSAPPAPGQVRLSGSTGRSVADKNFKGTPGIQKYLLSTCCMLGFGAGLSLGGGGEEIKVSCF